MRDFTRRKTRAAALPILLLCLASSPEAEILIGPTLSVGEIHRQVSHDMAQTTGIYQYGAAAAYRYGFFEAGLLAEVGRFNRSNAYGAGLDVGARYGFFRDRFTAGAGIGLAYNGYVRERFTSRNSVVGEFSHHLSPYLGANATLFKRFRIGFDGLFGSEIYWKARAGLFLFEF